MVLVGDVTVIKANEKEYDGRKYYTCLGMAKDKEIYKFSAKYEDHPKEGDIFQMTMGSSDKDLKPFVKFERVK